MVSRTSTLTDSMCVCVLRCKNGVCILESSDGIAEGKKPRVLGESVYYTRKHIHRIVEIYRKGLYYTCARRKRTRICKSTRSLSASQPLCVFVCVYVYCVDRQADRRLVLEEREKNLQYSERIMSWHVLKCYVGIYVFMAVEQ